jgi:hypothetical protein
MNRSLHIVTITSKVESSARYMAQRPLDSRAVHANRVFVGQDLSKASPTHSVAIPAIGSADRRGVSIQDNRFREVPRRSNEAEEIAIIAELLCALMRRFFIPTISISCAPILRIRHAQPRFSFGCDGLTHCTPAAMSRRPHYTLNQTRDRPRAPIPRTTSVSSLRIRFR